MASRDFTVYCLPVVLLLKLSAQYYVYRFYVSTATYSVGVLGGLSYIPSHGGGLWESNINHSTGVYAFVHPSLKD